MKTPQSNIGLFWVVDGKVLSRKSLPQAAPVVCGKADIAADHFSTWRALRPAQAPVSYDYHPRGRVIYDTEQNVFMIYADRCLIKNKRMMKKIEAEFGLASVPREIHSDAHYQCHRCNRAYLSD